MLQRPSRFILGGNVRIGTVFHRNKVAFVKMETVSESQYSQATKRTNLKKVSGNFTIFITSQYEVIRLLYGTYLIP